MLRNLSLSDSKWNWQFLRTTKANKQIYIEHNFKILKEMNVWEIANILNTNELENQSTILFGDDGRLVELECWVWTRRDERRCQSAAGGSELLLLADKLEPEKRIVIWRLCHCPVFEIIIGRIRIQIKGYMEFQIQILKTVPFLISNIKKYIYKERSINQLCIGWGNISICKKKS